METIVSSYKMKHNAEHACANGVCIKGFRITILGRNGMSEWGYLAISARRRSLLCWLCWTGPRAKAGTLWTWRRWKRRLSSGKRKGYKIKSTKNWNRIRENTKWMKFWHQSLSSKHDDNNSLSIFFGMN